MERFRHQHDIVSCRLRWSLFGPELNVVFGREGWCCGLCWACGQKQLLSQFLTLRERSFSWGLWLWRSYISRTAPGESTLSTSSTLSTGYHFSLGPDTRQQPMQMTADDAILMAKALHVLPTVMTETLT